MEETDTTINFESYVLMCFNRIHAVSCDPNRAYSGYSQQSAIDQLYYSFPSRVKKGKICKEWDKLRDRVREVRSLPEKEREQANIEIVNDKMQIVTDLADVLNLLFAPPNEVLRAWSEASRKKEVD